MGLYFKYKLKNFFILYHVPLPVYNAVKELLECESDKTLFDPLR